MEGVRLEMAGLGIGTILELLPSAPPLDGMLGADLALGMGADTLALRGEVSVGGLSYERQLFGDVALRARYAQGAGQAADVRLALDSLEVLTADVSYDKRAEIPLDARIDLPGLPLQRLNVFLPEEMLRLSGVLSGKIRAAGTTAPIKRPSIAMRPPTPTENGLSPRLADGRCVPPGSIGSTHRASAGTGSVTRLTHRS